MIQILRLHGTEKRLYQWVAPLVMNSEVLRYNNGYPFKTGEKFVWYLAVDKRKLMGFVPVERRTAEHVVNNYYARHDSHDEILSELVDAVIAGEAEETSCLSAVVQTKHQEIFRQKGFEVTKPWKLYVKMQKDL